MRCDSCAAKGGLTSYWPLTEEFWNKKNGMRRCRACQYELRNARLRERWAKDPAFRAKELEKQRQYTGEARTVISIKKARYYDERREELQAKAREHYAANREAIRARQRARYARKRAEARAA